MSNRLANKFVDDLSCQIDRATHFSIETGFDTHFNIEVNFDIQRVTNDILSCDIDVATQKHLNKLLTILIAKLTWLFKLLVV